MVVVVVTEHCIADLPTFYEKNKKHFGKKNAEDFNVRKIQRYFLTSPDSTEITKLVLNNNTSICLYVICYDQ